MKILRGPSALESLPMYGGAADIVDGALLAPGTTGEQDLGAVIICAASATNCIAVKEGLYDYSVVGGDYNDNGTAMNLQPCNLILPGALLAADYDLTDAGVAIASMQSTTSIRVTSSEDTIDDFFFYVNSLVGVGQLLFITANDNTDYTIKSAPTVALDSTSTLTKIANFGFELHVLSSDRSKLISTAAAGTARLRTLYSEGKWQGSSGWERLNATKHHNLQLSGKAAAFRSVMAPVDSWFASFD